MSIKFTVFKGTQSGKIAQEETTLPSLGANEVLLKHTHSGVCGTDLHYLHTPMVLGHEGVGTVEALGESVNDLQMYVPKSFQSDYHMEKKEMELIVRQWRASRFRIRKRRLWVM